MLQWLRRIASPMPNYPVNEDERHWLDAGFKWILETYGEEGIRQGDTILPTVEYFPGSYHATDDELAALLVQVAQYMDFDPDRLKLRLYEDKDYHEVSQPDPPDQPFHYVSLHVENLGDPLYVVAMMARWIAQLRIMKDAAVSGEDENHQPIAEMLMVYQGLGIMAANTAILDSSLSTGHVSQWSMSRSTHLSMNMFGYVLGLYAIERGEEKPAWLSYLRPDVRSACRKTIRLKRAEASSADTF